MLPRALFPFLHYASLAIVWSFIVHRPSRIRDADTSLLSPPPGIIIPLLRPTTHTISDAQVSSNFSRFSSKLSATCDGNKYGREVKSGSCIDVLEIIPDLERPVSLGPRNQGSFMLGLWVLTDEYEGLSVRRPPLQVFKLRRLLRY